VLECFRIFVDLVDSGSFSRAAATNYLTQSAVSQRIQHLEEELGQELLVRGHGHVTPTKAGLAFYQTSIDILARFELGLEEVRSTLDVVTGRVRVGAVNSIGLYELPPYVDTYLRRYPDVDLDVEFLHSNEIYLRVLETTLDVGLVAYPTRNPQITATVFRHDEMVIVFPAKHPLADHDRVEPAELDGETFVTFESGNPTRKAFEQRFRHEKVKLESTHHYDNIETVKQAVEMGVGISALPLACVQREVAIGELSVARLAGEPWKRPLAILRRKGHTMSEPARRFVEVLRHEPVSARA
jgi:DNA-binding transcriptional LysR family regulator